MTSIANGEAASSVRAKLNTALGYIPDAYTGFVATGCTLPLYQYNAWLNMNSRTPHIAREDITSLQVAFPSFRLVSGSGEVGVGGAVTFTGSIEYPAATFTQLEWSGSPTNVQADNTYTLSDDCTVTIPKGALFWVRCFATTAAAGGLPYTVITGYGVVTGSVSGTTMTVTAINGSSGGIVLRPGMAVSGTGITGGSVITDYLTGSGGLGTYKLSASSSSTGSITITATEVGTDLCPGINVQLGGASSLSDLTMSSSYSQDAVCLPPCAIVATTRKPSFLILGDSTYSVNGYDLQDWSTDCGLAARAIGPHFGYSNVSVSAETAQNFIAQQHTHRVSLADYASHVVDGLGLNDLATRTVAQVLADKQTILGYYTDKIICHATVPPYTTSSDMWATTTNQTSQTPFERNTYNDRLRARQPGVSHVFDFATPCESFPASGYWRVDRGFPTVDGIHPTMFIHRAVADANAFDAGRITRASIDG